MARGKKPVPTPPARRPWRATAAIVVTFIIVAGAVVALRTLGDEALRRIGARDRYRTPFAEIACDTPPGLDRPTFLAEVRYVGELPETINALDAADRDRLNAGFAKHPWVESVDGVTAEPGGVVRVALRFRTPVLVVGTTDGLRRMVDATNILLPVAPTPPGIAELVGTVPPPTCPAGDIWADPLVATGVRLVEAYRPTRITHTPTGWQLTRPDGKQYRVRP